MASSPHSPIHRDRRRTLPCIITILPQNHAPIIERFQQGIKRHGDECTDVGTDPVDPVIWMEGAGDDAGSEGASWVHAAACPEGAEELADEEDETYTDGGDEGSFVFLGGKHEDGNWGCGEQRSNNL